MYYKYTPAQIKVFLGRVNIRTEGCWEWLGTKGPTGYGSITMSGMTSPVHRVAYELFIGPIPKGLCIDHLCRNRGCVNPLHLEAVTYKENLLRGDTNTARNAKKTHCPKGHPYNLENTKVTKEGFRVCRTCLSYKNKLRYKASKGEIQLLAGLFKNIFELAIRS